MPSLSDGDGKLLKTEWLPSDGRACCFTCKYYDWDNTVRSHVVRVRTYSTIVRKTYFCVAHGESAKIEEEHAKA